MTLEERALSIQKSVENKYSIESIKKVIEEYDNYLDKQYSGKSMKERKELNAFYTPPELSILMCSKYKNLEKGKTLLDPTCGAGGLLACAILLGIVDPKDCYGIELDNDTISTCRNRLSVLGVPNENIQQGNALNIDERINELSLTVSTWKRFNDDEKVKKPFKSTNGFVFGNVSKDFKNKKS